MAYLIWQIEARSPLPDQIARAAEAFHLRMGSPATHLVVHHADHERITAVTPLAQIVTESSAATGTVNPGMFWIGTPA
ncbi:MAG TPA: hypothetical protein VGE07_11935 [Herpetosiphonaceae bacterium]